MFPQTVVTIVLSVLFTFHALSGETERRSDDAIISHTDTALQKLIQIHLKIKQIHPYLNSLHPIAVVEGESLFIFDSDSLSGAYRFQKKVPLPFPMDKGIRASFPLSSYGDRPTCVVSSEVFESLNGYATIFHEFVHCAQYLTCENRLKQRLHIAQNAAQTKQYSWEINHPFPYNDSAFVGDYSAFLLALTTGDMKPVKNLMKDLKDRLALDDYEYMVWVEWKEGLARFIENKIRATFHLEDNQGGKEQPYNRVTFYFGGEMFIRFLTRGDQDNVSDPAELFEKMFAFGGEK